MINDLGIWIISCLISTLGFIYAFYQILDIKFELNFQQLLVIVLISIYIAYLQLFGNKLQNMLLFFIFFPLYYKISENVSLKKIYFYTFSVWIVVAIFDVIFMLGVSSIFSIDLMTKVEIPFYAFIATILVTIGLLCLAKSNKFKKMLDKLYNLLSKIVYIDIAIFLFILLLFSIEFVMLHNLHDLKISVLLFIITLLGIVIFLTLIGVKIKNLETKLFIKILKSNNDFYIKMVDEEKIFKHNLVNKLLAVRSVANDKAIKLIDNIISNYTNKSLFLSKFKSVPYGLKGIIYEKTYKYRDKLNIKIDYEIEEDLFDILKPSKYNILVEKMGVLLDNAIEEAMKSHEKLLFINIVKNGEEINFKIINTFDGDLDIDKLGVKNYSTKGNNHGFGLFSIIRNANTSVSIEVKENKFISTLRTKI